MSSLTSAGVPAVGPDDHVRGAGPEAILYLDLACQHCAASWPGISRLPLRLVFRHFPVVEQAPARAGAPRRGRGCRAAGRRGGRLAVHRLVYRDQGTRGRSPPVGPGARTGARSRALRPGPSVGRGRRARAPRLRGWDSRRGNGGTGGLRRGPSRRGRRPGFARSVTSPRTRTRSSERLWPPSGWPKGQETT